jgi:hypothetical protein
MFQIDEHSYVLRAVNGKNDMLFAIRFCGALQCRRDGRLRLWRSEQSAAKALRKINRRLLAV